MKLRFTKMQGAGNDYIYLDCRQTGLPPDPPALARQLSRRRFSVGADGLICIGPPLLADADAAMYIWNADGSEGAMCGNGARCVAEYLYTHGVDKALIELDTPGAGRKTLFRTGEQMWQAGAGSGAAAGCTIGGGGAFLAGTLPEYGQPPLCGAVRQNAAYRRSTGGLGPRAGAASGISPAHQCGICTVLRGNFAGCHGVGAGQRCHAGLRHRGLRGGSGAGAAGPVSPGARNIGAASGGHVDGHDIGG